MAEPATQTAEATTDSTPKEPESQVSEGMTVDPKPEAIEKTEQPKEDLTPNSDENDVDEIAPIFDDEKVTEAQLKGEEDPQDGKTAESESKGTETKEGAADDKEKSSDDGKEGEKETEESKDAEAEPETPKTKVPPKGYVPIQALKEARETIKKKNAKIAELEAQEKKEDGKEFKLLSEQEFLELQRNDPDEAQLYIFREQRYREKEKLQQEVQADEERLEQYHENRSIQAVETVQKEFPDYYNPESGAMKKMAEFAISQGFDPEMLNYMTMPKTLILPPGGEAPITLGEGAASLIRLIGKTMALDPEAVKADTIAELEKTITEKIKKELGEKLNNETGSFTSIADVGGEQTDVGKKTKVMSEAQWANLTEEQQEALLRNA